MDEPWFYDPAPGPKLVGPVIILTSTFTFSAAEDFTVFASSLPNVVRIGATTAGSTGNSIRLELPGGLLATICAERHAWPDGREYVGVGIAPHIPVESTIADSRAGRDPVLDVARQRLSRMISRDHRDNRQSPRSVQ
jgi:C-terminal processing protease CtpA/Prc